MRVRAIDTVTADIYRPAFDNVLNLANVQAADMTGQFETPLAHWPERGAIIRELWNKYSRVLDIRIEGEPADFMLWEAVNIRSAFAGPGLPAAEHLCIAILILEGAVGTIASANWDGFIEAAIESLSPDADGVLQVVVDPDHLRGAAGRAKLLKFHGCITHAAQDPAAFREFLTGSRTQITEWPDKPKFAAMRNAVTDVATNQKSLVVGLSIQDSNLSMPGANATNDAFGMDSGREPVRGLPQNDTVKRTSLRIDSEITPSSNLASRLSSQTARSTPSSTTVSST